MSNWPEIFPKDKYFAIRGVYDNNREIILYSYEPRVTPPVDSGSHLQASIYPTANDGKMTSTVGWDISNMIACLSDDDMMSLWKYSKTLLISDELPTSIWHQERLARSGLEKKGAVDYVLSPEKIAMDEKLEAYDIENWQKPMAQLNKRSWLEKLLRV